MSLQATSTQFPGPCLSYEEMRRILIASFKCQGVPEQFILLVDRGSPSQLAILATFPFGTILFRRSAHSIISWHSAACEIPFIAAMIEKQDSTGSIPGMVLIYKSRWFGAFINRKVKRNQPPARSGLRRLPNSQSNPELCVHVELRHQRV
jgi:hypothetical protein